MSIIKLDLLAKYLIIIFIIFMYFDLASGQSVEGSSGKNWINDLDIYQKIFGGIVATAVTLFGLPLSYMNFKKTKAEIKKLELEAASIEGRDSQSISENGVYNINIENSDGNIVKIMADPRFLAPLLLLLDFIIAWIVINLSSYALNFILHPLSFSLFPNFISNIIETVVMGIIYIVLLIPIVREAKRVKSVLSPMGVSEKN